MKQFLLKLLDKLYMTKVKEWLRGKKTYILMIILILSQSQDAFNLVNQYASDAISLAQLIDGLKVVIGALAGMSLRAGLDNAAKPQQPPAVPPQQ